MILGIVQARVSSRRLPRKVLMEVAGKPLLLHQLERLKRSRHIDQLLIATSNDFSDTEIVKLAEEAGIQFFCGSLDDVLDRFYQAALTVGPDHIVRSTADCPLIDPVLVDELIEFYLSRAFDYASNALEPTLPDGLDTEIFSFATLKRTWQEAKLASEREHVTRYIYTHPDIFSVGSFKYDEDLSDLRWTVDEPEDFVLIEKIFSALYPENPEFRTPDILEFLKTNPELNTGNAHIHRNEGMLKSVQEDFKVPSNEEDE